MTDGNTIILYVPKDKVIVTEDKYIVDTGKTAEEFLLMMSGAIAYPGRGVTFKEGRE